MSHEIESAVFSAREGAGWTGLGMVIDASIANDPRKIAEACGANYQVEKRDCFYSNPDGSYTAAPNRSVLVRSDTNAMLEVTSTNSYNVINRQPIDIFEVFRDDLASENMEISHAAVLRGGSIIAVCAALKDRDTFINGNDRVNHYVTLSTGYDKQHGTKATKGSVRVVCANTLAYSLTESGKTDTLRTIRASTAIEFGGLCELIGNVENLIATETHMYNALANRQMNNNDVTRFFADVLEINIADLGKRNANNTKLVSTRAENMLRELTTSYNSAPGAGMASGTAWGALNAVTHYATHVKTVRDTKGDGDAATRLASNMFGDSAKLKARALSLLANSYSVAA